MESSKYGDDHAVNHLPAVTILQAPRARTRCRSGAAIPVALPCRATVPRRVSVERGLAKRRTPHTVRATYRRRRVVPLTV